MALESVSAIFETAGSVAAVSVTAVSVAAVSMAAVSLAAVSDVYIWLLYLCLMDLCLVYMYSASLHTCVSNGTLDRTFGTSGPGYCKQILKN